MGKRWMWLGPAVAVLWMAACESGNANTGGAGPSACVPGLSQACVGPASCSGFQICAADGSGFGACDCGGVGGSGGGGPGGAGNGGGTSVGGGGNGGASPGCDDGAGCAACALCSQGDGCSAEWAACGQACLDAVDCLSQCEAICDGNPSCYGNCASIGLDTCKLKHPSGYDAAVAVSACACASCPTSCGGVSNCAALDPFVCQNQGFFPEPTGGAARYYPDILEVHVPQITPNGLDVLFIELYYGFGASHGPHSIELDGGNYDTCIDCLRIMRYDPSDDTFQYFLGQTGTITITENGDVGDTFTASLDNVTLAEITFDPLTFHSTLVPDGETWCIAHLATSHIIDPGTGNCTTPPLDPAFGCNPNVAACSADPCDRVEPQCGCAPGANCAFDFDGSGDLACLVAGSGQVSAPCGSNLECAVGHQCIYNGGIGRCLRACDNDSQCTGPGAACVLTISPDPARWCSESCALVGGSPCVSGMGCDAALTNGAWYTFCRAAGAKTQGDACTSGSDCAAGLDCVTVNSVSFCAQSCDRANPSCPANTACAGYGTPLIIGGTEYGACI